jgi:hypothetical protein
MRKSTERVFSGSQADLSEKEVVEAATLAYYSISKGETPDSFCAWPSMTNAQHQLAYKLVGALWPFVSEK